MTDNLQQRIDQSASGTPLLKPDEQAKYLGTFRERCYVSMTVAQMKKETSQTLLIRALTKYPEAKILINGHLPTTLQSNYIQTVTSKQHAFTIVTPKSALTEDAIGLLLVSDQAVHEEVIDIEEKFQKKTTSTKQPVKDKKSFWNKWF
ncbi:MULTISPECIES: YueI family protein [Enterococcus]|uniref:DUF1694 domain-containing protein n=1 Tax=Enterococcus alcedinis TaxID=1274384 RepID=A0A917JG13_9ENTE|nr:YueI family protein [Enterococcus alcedinis]MBP2101584.1 uncharacterized protein YueI [Enterococcus alcedinis]GGI65021.1 hypothetical protein GCM10011482_06750 [Enterococcus alcedinis]